MSWCEVLGYFSRPNFIAAAVGVLWSVGVEYIPIFQALEPRWKRLIFLLLSLVVPTAAAGLGVWTCGWEPSWDGLFWPALLAGVAAFSGGTVAHVRKL